MDRSLQMISSLDMLTYAKEKNAFLLAKLFQADDGCTKTVRQHRV
jgi:hypothetical protein